MATDPDEVASRVIDLLGSLADFIEPCYPHHAESIRRLICDGITGPKDWDTAAAILNSLHAVPGVFLQGDEHDRRNRALSLAEVARRMVHAGTPSNKGASDSLDFVDWRSRELLAATQ